MEEKNEFELTEELEGKRKSINTLHDLFVFLKDINDNPSLGYGGAPISIAQAALATAWYFAKEMGITGFQAGFVMWDFVRNWQYSTNKCGLRILDYDDMLYPQYDHKFEKTIRSNTWNELQETAKNNLETREHAHPDVIAHWKSIAAGNIPFGYSVCDD